VSAAFGHERSSWHRRHRNIGGWPPITGLVSAWGETNAWPTATTNWQMAATWAECGGGRQPAGRRPPNWTSLAFCCAAAGEISLRSTILLKAQRSPAYLPLRTGDGPSVFAHRQAYPMLVGRDIQVDCRRRLGVRSFSSPLPPDLGLRTSFGRETGGDRRDSSASGANAPPN
jgi:hypothetical protein